MKSKYRSTVAFFFVLFFTNSTIAQQKVSRKTDFEIAEELFWAQKPDSAFIKFNQYINNSDNVFKKGMAYTYIGEILWNNGDLYGAQESLTNAIFTFNPDSSSGIQGIGFANNLLGNISNDLKLYDEAINYYDKSLVIFKGTKNVLEPMNGKATALQKKGDYMRAISIYDSILANKSEDLLLIARCLDNRAKTRWLADSSYPALAEFHAALKIRTDSQYLFGLNASYAHLSDYYAKSNSDSATWYAEKMLEVARLNRSPEDILEALDKLIRLNTLSSLKDLYYNEFKKLNDSLHFSRDTTRSRFAMIRYDFQKSKADNLVLQQHITEQRFLMYGLTALAVLVIVSLSIWYDKRKKRIKRESENAIRDAQLKTSQKIHDVVANGLYGIMNELEHGQNIEHEPLISKIEQLYEKSRDISYENYTSLETINYDRHIHQVLNAFATEKRKILIVGNQPEFWKRVGPSQKKELELILNEILVNMKKHSHSSNVVFAFRRENGKAYINYTDDGVGFPSNLELGNGLKNTVSRIKTLNGAIKFENRQEQGVLIELSFPLM